jgi:glycosyltransferase involved in cell wall biosynthesis
MSSIEGPASLVAISHAGDRSGAPILLLRFLDWMVEQTPVRPEVVLLHGGSLEHEFDRFGARVLGGSDSRLWMVQRGLTNLGYGRAGSALAWARHGPLMRSHRNVDTIFMNSVGSLPAVRFLPAASTAKVVLYIHELDTSFESTIGTTAWEKLSPRVDHFITCGARVTEMLVDRRGVDPERITEHIGFIDPPAPAPDRWAATRRDLGIPEGAFVVGASGQPDWRKAPEVFVRMARTLAHRRPDLDPHFVWMGGELDASPAWKLAHDASYAGIADRFHHVPETAQPADVMGAMDVFALTSREDPYPLIVLEAAALAIPVVSFDNGGVVQFAETGGGEPLAEIVDFLDSDAMVQTIAALADDGERRQALAERARRFVLDHQLTAQAAPRLYETLRQLAPGLPAPTDRPSLVTS